MIRRALVLARGAGSRMREDDPGAVLTPAQQQAAAAGLKALMPVAGRPFLDYVLDSLLTAGLTDLALVVPPGAGPIRSRYERGFGPNAAPAFVAQDEPRGTAHAVACAESWTAGEPFLVLNADNLYPEGVLRALASLDGPGLPVFDRDDLIASSNIPAGRIRAFALVELDGTGHLAQIIEKPPPDLWPADGAPALVSMNCWAFDAGIFPACRDVRPSARGELELPEAVMLAVARGMRLRGIPARGPVLDLSRRGDTRTVEDRLARRRP
jgi:glucose-1-phosphate thymidylyltransferase